MTERTFSTLDRMARSPAGVFALIALYVSVLALLRATLFSGIAEDDAEQIYYAQNWAWGYKGNQPPLFTWLVRSIETMTGPGIWAVLLVKFASLAALYGFSLAAARHLIEDPVLALLAALSPMAIFYIGWDGTVNYSNSILLAACQAATLYALLRLMDRRRWLDYALLGLAITCGILAKYNFALFLCALSAFAIVHPGLRPALLDRKTGVSLAFVLIFAAPHAYWSLTDPAGMATVFDGAAPWAVAESFWLAALQGLGNFVLGCALFLMPMLAIVIALFPGAFWRLGRRASTAVQSGNVYILAFLIAGAAGVLISGATDIQNHWLFGLVPVSLFVFCRVEAVYGGARPAGRRALGYGAVLLVLALAVPVGLSVRAATAPETCRKCNFFLPWEDVARELRADGVSGGTIIAFDYPNQIAGNLRPHFPTARFASNRFSPVAAPPARAPGSCLIIWNPAVEPEGYGQEAAFKYAKRLFGTDVPPDQDIKTVAAPISGNPARMFRLNYVLFPDGSAHCG